MAERDAAITEHTVLGGRVRLRQLAEGYRAAIDPVLLAAAVPARAGDRVLDLGAGVGTALLCLAARVPEVTGTGLEIQPRLVELARENLEINEFSGEIDFVEGDIKKTSDVIVGAFDHVMFNPPYFDAARSRSPNHPIRAIANMQGEGGLEAWIGAGLGCLKRRGTLTLIYTAERLDEALSALAAGAGSFEVFPFWPNAGKPAKRVVVRAVKEGRGPTVLHPGLALHQDSGDYTPEALRVLRDGEALGF
jgi:tRNA1(Val) A37 N6-methylase TrmN6